MKSPLRSMLLRACTAVAVLSLVAVSAPSALAVKGGGTLTVAQPWGTIPNNFNPYTAQGGRAPGTLSCIYQSLYYINAATGAETPLLATKFRWTNHNRNLVVTTRRGVKWTDGKAFSAADVAFTFNYLKANPTLDLNGIWATPLKSVKANGANSVVFTFKKAYTPASVAILFGNDTTSTSILPKHIWASVTNPAAYANTHPVGTGPFKLSSYSTTSVTFTKNASYFQRGRPYIQKVVFSSVDSNTTAELQLMNGTIDMGYDAMSDVERTFVSHDPANNHYFWPVVSMNYLYLNTAKAPFSTVSFRRGVAYALNPSFLASRAYFGALPGATGGAEAAIVHSQLAKWYDKSLKKYEWSYSPTKAKAVLKAAGFKWSSSGELQSPSGQTYPTFNLLIGGPGWSDYISLATNVASELHAIGIKATVVQEPFSTYMNDLTRGNFDFAISWGNANSSTPYYQYNAMFSPAFSAPIGQVAVTNWQRYTSPVITNALNKYASNSSFAVQRSAMSAIEKDVLTHVPVVPLTARANWLVYQTRKFTGFPSKTRQYNDGSASDWEGGMIAFLNVHLK